MKFTKVFKQIAILLLIGLSAIDSSKLRRSKTKGPMCVKAFLRIDDVDQPSKTLEEHNVVFPQEFQTGTKVVENAKKQTLAARKFWANLSVTIQSILTNVAENLKRFFNENKDLLENISLVQRQIKNNASWEKDARVSTTLAHLKNLKDPISSESLEGFLNGQVESIVKKEYSVVESNSYLGLVGLLGDLGAAVQDFYGRKDPGKKVNNANEKIAAHFEKFFGDIKDQAEKYYNQFSPDKYYDHENKSEQSKQGERPTCKDDKDLKIETTRSGVLNVGEEVDEEIPKAKRLGKLFWPWQTVPKKLVETCPDEPWAGHFSGSLYELLFMLELFNRGPKHNEEQKEKKYKHVALDSDLKGKYSAIATAFLTATGMHSAVEQVYVIKNYLETKKIDVSNTQTINADTKKNVCDEATNYIADEIITKNNTDPKKKLKKIK